MCIPIITKERHFLTKQMKRVIKFQVSKIILYPLQHADSSYIILWPVKCINLY